MQSDQITTALLLWLIASALSFSALFTRLDNLLYDVGQRVSKQSADASIVIVAIDESSLNKLGRWPWSRALHAELVERLHHEGAKVIALDLILSEPDETHPEADAQLANAIERAGNVVMPILIEEGRLSGPLIETLPLSELAKGAAALGSVHIPLDQDGIARGVYLREGVGSAYWPLFAEAILNTAKRLPSSGFDLNSKPTLPSASHHAPSANDTPYDVVRSDYRGIHFIGPSGRFPRLSYAQVLAGQYPKNVFRNKWVLVGATAAGLGDLLPTPVSGQAQPMPGVELHAHVVQNMVHDQLITPTPPWITLLVAGCVALLPLIWLPRLTPMMGLSMTVCVTLIIAGSLIMMPSLLGIWCPPSGGLVALLTAYPVWSWRKLESANRFLDAQLNLMQHELKTAGLTLHTAYSGEDPLQSRIHQVQQASAQLQNLQSHKRETLAFISHDIRAPLASAIQQLDALEQGSVRQDEPLTQVIQDVRNAVKRAHALSEEFLHTSRAEMADTTRFQELDLNALAHQAADDVYALAVQHRIRLIREIGEEPVWVKGEFGLLLRAMTNLLVNAIHYAPQESEVRLQLKEAQHHAWITVTDQGVGIPAQLVDTLFKRFNRVVTDESVQKGAGLGLYFVDTVMKKHQGEVLVHSEPHVATSFTLRIPCSVYS